MFDHITQEMFDAELMRILSQKKASQLIHIPGIYEILSEEYNNQILDNLSNGEKQNENKA